MGKVILQAAAAGSGLGDFFLALIMIGIIVLLFIVFRNIVLWYYKLDIIAKSIEDQTQIQRAILSRLEALDDDKYKKSDN